MRKTLERFFLKSIRFYTFNTPIKKGKYRLYQTALKLCRYPPTQLETKTDDGRHFSIDLSSGMQESVYFIGEYERAVTELISAIVKAGDVCLDVGANFGWYTMPFSSFEQSRKECKCSLIRTDARCICQFAEKLGISRQTGKYCS